MGRTGFAARDTASGGQDFSANGRRAAAEGGDGFAAEGGASAAGRAEKNRGRLLGGPGGWMGENHSALASAVVAMHSSSSCFWSTTSGQDIIRSLAFCTLGKAMTSRMEDAPAISMQRRSKP